MLWSRAALEPCQNCKCLWRDTLHCHCAGRIRSDYSTGPTLHGWRSDKPLNQDVDDTARRPGLGCDLRGLRGSRAVRTESDNLLRLLEGNWLRQNLRQLRVSFG